MLSVMHRGEYLACYMMPQIYFWYRNMDNYIYESISLSISIRPEQIVGTASNNIIDKRS